MTYIELSYLDLALAASLLIANGAISLAFKLGLEKSLVTASLRLVVQLVLVALALNFIFEATSPWLTAGFALVMGRGPPMRCMRDSRRELQVCSPSGSALRRHFSRGSSRRCSRASPSSRPIPGMRRAMCCPCSA